MTCLAISKHLRILSRTSTESHWQNATSPNARATAVDSIMTSKSATECFVYITLPRAEAATLAGRFVLEETSHGEPLGQFVYGRSYLRNPDAVEIDPVELKLSDTTYETTQLNGVFGALRDAGPDFW